MTTPTLVLLAALACIPSAHARWECTMPNGRTIQREFGPCPQDAIEKRQTAPDPDTERPFVHIPKPVEPQESPRADQRLKPPPKEQAQKERDVDPVKLQEGAQAICTVLQRNGATTCTVDMNVFSASTIDATISLLPEQGQALCLAIANQTRQANTAFTHYRYKGMEWWLKLYHPLGSGNRPMANCRL